MRLHQATKRLYELRTTARRLLLIATDSLVIAISVWLSFWLRITSISSIYLMQILWMFPAAIAIGVPVYILTGQYKGLTRYVGSKDLYGLAARNGLLVLILSMFGIIAQLSLPPRSSWFLIWLVLTALGGILRFGLRDLIHKLQSAQHDFRKRVAIYGAHTTGVQLAAALRLSGRYEVVVFFEEDLNLCGREINGIPIHSPTSLGVFKKEIDQILLSMQSPSKKKLREIIRSVQSSGIPVLQVPSLDDLTRGTLDAKDFKPIEIEQLLGRDSVDPDPKLIERGIAGQSILVTGAGGSIGSELCMQILEQAPHTLVTLEHNELSLYNLSKVLDTNPSPDTRVVQVLGNAADGLLVEKILKEYSIDAIFHAAAYKHVPLVESNPIAGIANNALATWIVGKAALEIGIPRFILVSTDKAVRPTNVMGATKRLAELIVQELGKDKKSSTKTRFSIVRFGNVLDSSGSVVPLFREQISSGGPITLTHPEVMRYFMTIPEAAQLVIQAAALARGGELFLLDMGDPVMIKELAMQMVLLSGRTVRDADHPDGEIEIECTGLRAGEKLREELLVDGETEPTQHPLIYKAKESGVNGLELWPILAELTKAVNSKETDAALRILHRLVPEWERSNQTRRFNDNLKV